MYSDRDGIFSAARHERATLSFARREQVMSNITRTDPLTELTRFEPFRDLETFMGWPRFRRWMHELPAVEPTMKVDVTESDNKFIVKADIAIEVKGDQVSISAEVKRETEEKKGDTLVHSERYYGKQLRSFTLGTEIDRNNVAAKFADGVLELTLPKVEKAAVKRIAVQ
jgi:HSP20 family protein